MCDLLFGVVDLFSVLLIILPLYPNTIEGFVYSVSLLNYSETSEINIIIYWITFILLFAVGLVKLTATKLKNEKANKFVILVSIGLNILIVLFLALTRQAYAVVIAFLLLVVKGGILLKYSKSR